MSGIYRAEQPNLVGYVKAYNQASADAQMKWVKEHQTCFCKSCVEDLAQDYLVYIEARQDSTINHHALPGGVHAV